MNVLVAGGAGFVGRALCAELAARGHDVTAASRSPDPGVLPDRVATAELDVTDPPLHEGVAGHDAVVNLVALPSHVESSRSHERVHLGGTRNLLRASEATAVERFVQLGGLGVDAGVDTAYFRAKRRAERLVRDADTGWVVYRPSVVFGDGCAFLPFVRRLARPGVVPLPGGGRSRLHPIWVGDLAPMLADGVTDADRAGGTYELGGPAVLTLADIVRLVGDDPTVVPVPGPVAAVGATVAEAVPGLPVGRDQYRALGHDNVADPNDVTAFGVSPGSLLSLEAYLRGEAAPATTGAVGGGES
jgi:NADH dehydrogenase